MTTVLVTGANGFAGRALCAELVRRGYKVRGAVRSLSRISDPIGEPVEVGDINAATDWSGMLAGIDAVIHLAARVHLMREDAVDPLAEFRKVNVEGALNLAGQAAKAGVRRFIFISSIKVNGESTPLGKPYTADDKPAPSDPYGISKHEAEEALRQIAAETGMEVVIIRPPLVYGPGVKANFLTLMRWLNKGLPLPLGAIDNKRSLVALDNLLDLIVTCMDHPGAVNQTFLVSDGDDLSTPELMRRIASALGRRAWLLPVPIWLLQICAGLLGKRSAVQKLCGSLQLNIDKTREQLGWMPPLRVDEALRITAEDFLRRYR
jgi:UDP-glucose 4-epimerase